MGGVRERRWRTFSYQSERGTLSLGPGGYRLVQQGGTAGRNRRTGLKVSREGEKNEISLWVLLHRLWVVLVLSGLELCTHTFSSTTTIPASLLELQELQELQAWRN